ncbi:MAG: hypothetical protein KAR79_00200 [Simkaniaceae bacterium]|nr:hypothetical protein [Simkaniaceae bacterium]
MAASAIGSILAKKFNDPGFEWLSNQEKFEAIERVCVSLLCFEAQPHKKLQERATDLSDFFINHAEIATLTHEVHDKINTLFDRILRPSKLDLLCKFDPPLKTEGFSSVRHLILESIYSCKSCEEDGLTMVKSLETDEIVLLLQEFEKKYPKQKLSEIAKTLGKNEIQIEMIALCYAIKNWVDEPITAVSKNALQWLKSQISSTCDRVQDGGCEGLNLLFSYLLNMSLQEFNQMEIAYCESLQLFKCLREDKSLFELEDSLLYIERFIPKDFKSNPSYFVTLQTRVQRVSSFLEQQGRAQKAEYEAAYQEFIKMKRDFPEMTSKSQCVLI